MGKAIIGISASLCPIDTQGLNIHSSVSRRFADHVQQLGGLPMIIPVSPSSLAKDYAATIDKLILTGGQHVHPQFYGEKKTIDSDDYSVERDEFELALLMEMMRQHKPVLAVCRGMQLVNVAFGGTLHQQIDHHWQGLPFGTSHSIDTKKGSLVHQLFGQASRINSVHRQSIKSVASSFRVTAMDPRDQTIEAIESLDEAQRIIGLQWHPEFLVHEEKGNLELFRYFLEQF